MMTRYSQAIKRLIIGFFIILYFIPVLPMSWFGMGAEEQAKKVWIKHAQAGKSLRSTASVLSELLSNDQFPDAINCFRSYLRQCDEQSQYALRWAHHAVDDGSFPMVHELLSYYQRRFDEGIATFSKEEIEVMCELIMKADLLFRLAYEWIRFRGNVEMTKKGCDRQRIVCAQYHGFLTRLLKVYEPSYSELYQRVSSWIASKFDTLKTVSPVWIVSCDVVGEALVFKVPESAILDALWGHSKESLSDKNCSFLSTSDASQSIGLVDRGSWQKFCTYLNCIIQSK